MNDQNIELKPLQPRLNRRYDLDWLRTLAVLLLVPFHAALVFIQDPKLVVYLKDTANCLLLQQFASFINVWQMPLLFWIAGASSYYALSSASPRQYLRERALRLGVPLAFGLLVLVPVMTYIHYFEIPNRPGLLDHYVGFFTRATDLTGLDGGFTPAHLWFIAFLAIFSCLALPLFRWLRQPAGQRLLGASAAWLNGRGLLLLLALPLALASATGILGAQNPLVYFLVFLLGYWLSGDQRFQQAIDRDTFIYLGLGVVLFAGQVYFDVSRTNPHFEGVSSVFLLAETLARWAWTLTLLGLGHRLLNFSNRALKYLGEVSYPFYILHLSVLTAVSFFMVQVNTDPAVKYLLIVALTTVASFAIYEALVRPLNPIRFLLGMKPLPAPVAGPQKPSANFSPPS
jgi:glucans biosynthesis protein C